MSTSITPSQRKRRAALLSIASNTFLVVGKLTVGILTRSMAVISEAVHSATDLTASFIAFVSVSASDTPPDHEHPYGHGKIESISGLSEALLIFAAAIYITYQALSKLISPSSELPQVDAGMIVMGVSAVTNFWLSRYLKKVGRETDSLALLADGEHLSTDVWTSVGVFVGLVLTQLTHAPWVDPLTALLVAALIFHAAYDLSRDSLAPLLDARLPEVEEEKIRQVFDADDRVLGYHKLRTRKAGSQRHVDVHVQIDDDSTLMAAHDCTEELEDQIRKLFPEIFINIHTEPFRAEMRHQREVHGLEPTEVNLKRNPEPS